MKTFLRPLAAAVLILAPFAGCDKKPSTKSAAAINPESAKTFDATAAHLDAGGDFYLYLRTEQILERVPALMDEWKTALVEMTADNPSMPPDQIDAWYAVARKAFIDTGLTELRAFGMSGLRVEPGLSRTKSAMLVGDGAKNGVLWQLGGNRPPHAFDTLDMLPATTVYTAFSDLDATVLHGYVMQIIDGLPDAALKVQAQQFPTMAEIMLGMPLGEFLASLGTEFGFVVTADDSATMTIPAAPPIELPKMAAAILFRVSDDKLYDLLAAKIDETAGRMMPVQKSDVAGLRSVSVPIPNIGLPLTPTVARFGDYVAISTSPELVSQLARVENPPALLKDTEAFKRFFALEKMEGNGFAYLSEAGSAVLRKIQMNSFESDGTLPPAFKRNLEKFYDMFSQRFMFTIARNEKDAVTSVMYSPNGSEQLTALVAVVPVAVAGAIAIPAIAKAKAEILTPPTPPAQPAESVIVPMIEPGDASDQP